MCSCRNTSAMRSCCWARWMHARETPSPGVLNRNCGGERRVFLQERSFEEIGKVSGSYLPGRWVSERITLLHEKVFP